MRPFSVTPLLSAMRDITAALILVVGFSGSAMAQVYKCKGADGKLQFSDRPCPGANTAEIVPNKWGSVSAQDRLEAQQRASQMQQEANQLDAAKADAAARQRQDNQVAERAAAASAAANQQRQNDADAMAACVKDVERRGASQNVKAEMMAACRTAGAQQRASGSSSLVSDCVKNVERSGASEKEKARQIALCHGGDVQPERLPPPAPITPAVITSCDRDGCWDSKGRRYEERGNTLIRSDGKPCIRTGTTLQCN